MKNNIAIITARGGSKRIPRKNIKNFVDKPILAYSIESCVKSGLFSEIMVSTDDQEIATIALQYGAKVPFLRSIVNSDDFSTTADVLLEVLNEYKLRGMLFDNACCLYPTAPFITAQKLKDAYQILEINRADTVIPVAAFSYPIWRSLKVEDEMLAMNFPENLNTRSQDFPAAYHDTGQFYMLNTNSFFEQKVLFTKKCMPLFISEMEMQDIDNEVDWELAELKYEFLKRNGKI